MDEETGAPAPSPPAGVGRPLAPLGQDARGVCARAGQAAVPAACVCGGPGAPCARAFPCGWGAARRAKPQLRFGRPT